MASEWLTSIVEADRVLVPVISEWKTREITKVDHPTLTPGVSVCQFMQLHCAMILDGSPKRCSRVSAGIRLSWVRGENVISRQIRYLDNVEPSQPVVDKNDDTVPLIFASGLAEAVSCWT